MDPKQAANPSHPADWVSKSLAAIDAISGFTFTAIAAACYFLLFVAPTADIPEYERFRAEWSGHLWAGLVFSSALAIGKIVRSVWRYAAKLVSDFTEARRLGHEASKRRQIVEDQRRSILKELDTLSRNEHLLIREFIDKNMKSISGNPFGETTSQLIAKGLLETRGPVLSALGTPVIMPDFVWDELQKRDEKLRQAITTKKMGAK